MSLFHFKSFSVRQSDSAMKIGTDAVLLGSWVDTNDRKNILEVGSGTGVIALMLAQRSEAGIDTIEPERHAFEECKFNIEKSPWKTRIQAINCTYQSYDTLKRYDLIVSNPPFFIDSYKSKDSKRNQARHSETLPFDIFLKKTLKLLSKKGTLALILPVKQSSNFIEKAKEMNLYCTRLTKVAGKKDKEFVRHLLEFERKPKVRTSDILVIEKERRHDYTEEYLNLVKNFLFLKGNT